jgi:hypothetical protein
MVDWEASNNEDADLEAMVRRNVVEAAAIAAAVVIFSSSVL